MRAVRTLAIAIACGAIGAAVTPAFANDTTADILWREATSRPAAPTSFEPTGTVAPFVVASGPEPLVSRAASGQPQIAAPTGGVDCTRVACVALTFDDGPAPDTQRLLGMLDEAGVKVTFFLVGTRAAKYPDIVQAEAAAGHEVANHTNAHEDLLRLDDEGVRATVTRDQNIVLSAASGVTPSLFRPPYGAHNRRVDDLIGGLGLPLILWDLDTLDWKTRNADASVKAVEQARPGSIILMHDIHPTSVDAVPRVIEALQAKGYTLVTVSQLLASEHPSAGHVYTHGPAPRG